MHRRRRSNNDVSNGTHHPSADEIDEEPNMEQDAAYYDDRQSPDYNGYHHNDDDGEQANFQRSEQSNFPALHQEQETQRGRGHRPTGASSGPGYSGARQQSRHQMQSQQQQQPTNQHRTTLEVHAQHDIPPGEDTEELTEPLLQQASSSMQCAPHGSLKDDFKHHADAAPAVTMEEHISSKPPINTSAALTSKLSPSSSISSSSLSSKTSKTSKTSNRHRLRKSRSKDAQTEIEHPKAPLVVAEDSEDLDGEEEEEEIEYGGREKLKETSNNNNHHNNDAIFDNEVDAYRGEDRRTLKSSASSSRTTIVPRAR